MGAPVVTVAMTAMTAMAAMAAMVAMAAMTAMAATAATAAVARVVAVARVGSGMAILDSILADSLMVQMTTVHLPLHRLYIYQYVYVQYV